MQRKKINILFLCTENSCRSQMAEAWCRSLLSEDCVAYSAGIATSEINPIAVRVMQEVGIDMDGHFAKRVEMLPKVAFDMCVTVCDTIREQCPYIPGITFTLHHSFPDAIQLSEGMDENNTLQVYRAIRDEIKRFVVALPNYFASVQEHSLVEN